MRKVHTYGKNPNAAADPHSVIQGDNYRFTVLNEYVLRMEYSSSGTFVDQETQIVLNRRFPVPELKKHIYDGSLRHKRKLNEIKGTRSMK